MYKNLYSIYVVCQAGQVVDLDHKNKTLDYYEIDEVYGNEHLQIFDMTNNCTVGQIEFDCDDEEMYALAHKMILEYEKNIA